jgi:hypothetical protein
VESNEELVRFRAVVTKTQEAHVASRLRYDELLAQMQKIKEEREQTRLAAEQAWRQYQTALGRRAARSTSKEGEGAMDLQLQERLDYYLAQADVGLTLSGEHALQLAGQVLWATRMALGDLPSTAHGLMASRLAGAETALEELTQ